MKKLTFITAIILGSIGISQAALTWSWGGSSGSQDTANAITSAMNTAVGNYNQYASFNGNIQVCYNSGVPTAQTDGYQGLIEFGGSISARVAQHEMGHWMGCGTYSDWNNHRNGNNQWTGAAAIAQLAAYDGAGSIVNADSLHFWPYGWNYDNEGPADRNIGMVCAFRKDMGLSDGISGSWCFMQNRTSGLVIDSRGATSAGSQVAQWSKVNSSNLKWKLVASDSGYYYIQNQTTGLYLDGGGSTSWGAAVKEWSYDSSYNLQWKLVPSDSGNYYIKNRATGLYLDGGGATANGAALKQWGYANSSNLQWSLQW
jgi:hypothetical protein